MNKVSLDVLEQQVLSCLDEISKKKSDAEKLAFIREKVCVLRETIDKVLSVIDNEEDTEIMVQHDNLRSSLTAIMKERGVTETELARELHLAPSTLLDFMKHYRPRSKGTMDILHRYVASKGF